MLAAGVILVVNGFGNRIRAAGGGRAIAGVINGTAVLDLTERVPIIRLIVIGGHCRVRTTALAITNVPFRRSGATAVSMV